MAVLTCGPVRPPLALTLGAWSTADLEADLRYRYDETMTVAGAHSLGAWMLLTTAHAGLLLASGLPLPTALHENIAVADDALWTNPEKGDGVQVQAGVVLKWLNLPEPEQLDLDTPSTDAELVNSILRSLKTATLLQEPLDLTAAYDGAAQDLLAQGIDVGHRPAEALAGGDDLDDDAADVGALPPYRAISALFGLPGGV